jgi:ribosome-binding protein aMBF1 (putative translation factor)
MRDESPTNPERRPRRLGDAKLTPEQRAAVKTRRAERQTPRYQDEPSRDIQAYRKEYAPAFDRELIEALAGLRRERERQGLSPTDMAERTGIGRATISKPETGKICSPTIGTLRTDAKALGRRLAWSLELVAKSDVARQ